MNLALSRLSYRLGAEVHGLDLALPGTPRGHASALPLERSASGAR